MHQNHCRTQKILHEQDVGAFAHELVVLAEMTDWQT